MSFPDLTAAEFREWMEIMRYTTSEVAERFGVTPGVISMWRTNGPTRTGSILCAYVGKARRRALKQKKRDHAAKEARRQKRIRDAYVAATRKVKLGVLVGEDE